MITVSDSLSTVDFGPYYAILPSSALNGIEAYCSRKKVKKVAADFSYNSGENGEFLSIETLSKLIKSLDGD